MSGRSAEQQAEINACCRKVVYLGDAVYVEHDGDGLVLTTKDGNRVVLAPEVFEALGLYVERIEKAVRGGK